MKCFYHGADLDGRCSGAIVKHFNQGCELISINYGDTFPWKSIGNDEVVYMVDFSLQPFYDMIQLATTTPYFHWIDHHFYAIKEHQKSQFPIRGKRKDGIGACQLVYEYLNPGASVPRFIQLLAQYDVWDHHDPDTLPFQYGMRLMETRPENQGSVWEELFNPVYSEQLVQSIIEKGATVLEYINNDNAKYCDICAFDAELDGLKCIAVNKMFTNSQVFASVWDSEKYDAMLTFGYRKDKWLVSLYTDKPDIDVSEIARARGGGGHKQAAGFHCEFPPFLKS